MNDLNSLEKKIVQWGNDRGIIPNGNTIAQSLKLFEEAGELAHAVARNNGDEIDDAVGDIIVVLIMLQGIRGKNIVEALNLAYEEIKDRRGFMNKEGIFIKEGDNHNV